MRSERESWSDFGIWDREFGGKEDCGGVERGWVERWGMERRWKRRGFFAAEKKTRQKLRNNSLCYVGF